MAIAGIIIGTFSLLALFVVEWLRTPRLHLVLSGASTTPPPGKCRFLRVSAENVPLPTLLARILNRNTAASCAADFVIYDMDDKQLKSSPAIWWPRQVVKIAVTQDNRVIDAEKPAPSELVRRDIPAGHEALITLAVKFEGNRGFYVVDAWTLQGEKDPNDMLEGDEYKVEVRVRCGRLSNSKTFLLLNKGANVEGFALTDYSSRGN